ncbi:DedA family protein [Bordetella avium]|uniref:DedA family protein n=1 Tax=Bordetella avium TaxID=521 RepID=UPI000E0C90E7|nr:DedA family protein [Bordetella avium]AZY48257.1 DedA family protein [Bordetella avium]RIQ13498.1 DedA family protein [Bordetella avium]RIQ31306.1 DedA family protein [Bordetella avium]RIQ36843.1 DedA family protein [Bordetella avium]RIQ40691.1 DedA family protein [Bordetella avium]
METLHHLLLTYGAWLLFACLYLESMGAPVPGESAVVASSLLALHGEMSFPGMLIAVFLGAVLGDCTGYAIGRFGGRRLLLRYGHFVKITPERLASLEAQFRKRGVYVVMGARFVVVLRQLNGLIAGSAGMPFHRFLAANIVGALAWTAVWGAGPYLVADVFQPLLHWWHSR